VGRCHYQSRAEYYFVIVSGSPLPDWSRPTRSSLPVVCGFGPAAATEGTSAGHGAPTCFTGRCWRVPRLCPSQHQPVPRNQQSTATDPGIEK
jgi:hypothetical protein